MTDDETLPGVRRHTFADGSTDRLGVPEPQEPTTEAGRALNAELAEASDNPNWPFRAVLTDDGAYFTDQIIEIEAEARAAAPPDIDVYTERDMLDIAYRDLRKAAKRVIEATQPAERDAAILDLDCVVQNGEPCASPDATPETNR